MNIKVIELDFFSSLTTIPESYTIFGGLCWAYYLLYGKENLEKDIIEKFQENNPPFLLSSIFPMDKNFYYLPKPIYKFIFPQNFDFSHLKKIKRMKFIDLNSFFEILESIQKDNLSKISDVLLKSKAKTFKPYSQPHVNLDKISYTAEGTGTLFYENYFFIDKGYFFIKFLEREIEDKIINCIEFISKNGLGGNKTTGMGKFFYRIKNVEETELKDLFNKKSNRFLSLSPIILKNFDKIDIENSYYEIYFFRGVVDNFFYPSDENIWKQKVCYMQAGSIIKKNFSNDTFLGFSPVVLNFYEKKIIQYGLEFPIYF